MYRKATAMDGGRACALPPSRNRRSDRRGAGVGRALVGLLAICASAAGAGNRGSAGQTAWRDTRYAQRLCLDWRPGERAGQDILEVAIDLEKLARLSESTGPVAPEALCLIAETAAGAGERVPFAARMFYGLKGEYGTVLRFLPPEQSDSLWLYFDGPADQQPAPPVHWNLLEGALDEAGLGAWHTTGQVTLGAGGGQAGVLELALEGGIKRAEPVEVYRRFPIPSAFRGQAVLAFADVRMAEGETYVPFSLTLAAYDEAGARIHDHVVDRRMMTMNLAAGQDVKFREPGRLHPRAAAVEVRFALRPNRQEEKDYFGLLRGPSPLPPDADRILVRVSELGLRAGRRLAFPGRNPELYAPGVSGLAADGSLHMRQAHFLMFHGYPPGHWANGLKVEAADAWHWPDQAGTVEFWFKPAWADTAGRHGFLQAFRHSTFSNDNSPAVVVLDICHDGTGIQVTMCDKAKRRLALRAAVALDGDAWHHLAFCWEPAAGSRELFLDGRSLARERGELAGTDIPATIHVGAMGRGREPAEACLDEIRISNVVRYSGRFAPDKRFASDAATRALFHLDYDKNGVHGGDDGFVLGAPYTAMSPTLNVVDVERRIKGRVEPRRLQWYPAELPKALDPYAVLPVASHRRLTAAELNAGYVAKRHALRLGPGQTATLECGGRPFVDFVRLAVPDGGTAVVAPLLKAADDVDPRSFASIARDLGLAALPTEHARATRLYAYLMSMTDYLGAHRREAYPSHVIKADDEPHAHINSYLQFMCGNLAKTVCHAFVTAGLSANRISGWGHCYHHVFYEGQWHLFDPTTRLFTPARDHTRAAALAEMYEDPFLMNLGGYHLGYYWPAVRAKTHFENRQLVWRDFGYVLRPGEAFTYHWFHTRTHTAREFKDGLALDERTPEAFEISNGVLEFDGRPAADHPAIDGWTADGFGYTARTPYVIVDADFGLDATFGQGGSIAVEMSVDGGRTWPFPVATLCATNEPRAVSLFPWARGRLLYTLRFRTDRAQVDRLRHRAFVQMNTRALTPTLKPGANRLRFSAQSGTADLVIGYREAAGQMALRGGIAHGVLPGREKYLLGCRPGGECRLTVADAAVEPQVEAPHLIACQKRTTGPRTWDVVFQPAADAPAGLYAAAVRCGPLARRVHIFVAPDLALWSPEQIASETGASLADDPQVGGRRVVPLAAGQALSLGTAVEAGTYRVYVLALRENRRTDLSFQVSGRAQRFAKHPPTYWPQQGNMSRLWNWYSAEPAEIDFTGNDTLVLGATGTAHVAGLIVAPTRDPAIKRIGRLLCEGYNYDPTVF
ncbi:MAG: hypothetical protein JXR37_01395 [Kiritimatiellae bacterium]|nr:hypothetical protein [Kiritimatiellia bacterium]